VFSSLPQLLFSDRLEFDGMRDASADALPDIVKSRLGPDDDPLLWVAVLSAAAEDASVLCEPQSAALYAIAGSCSHWARPHQSRWTAPGGFAAPRGYGDGEGFLGGLPNLDWSATLEFDDDQRAWVIPQSEPTKRFRSVRLAIPARSARHMQAAIHATWSARTLSTRRKRVVYYGFRKLEGVWRLLARDERGEDQGYNAERPSEKRS
jgi:hypothetical protein